MEKKWRNKNFFVALKNAVSGILFTIKSERNIKIQLVFMILALVFSAFFRINIIEWMFIISAIFLVLIMELLNTAIEAAVDMITEEYNEKAKIVKDVSSGAVWLASIYSVIIGIIIFLPKILEIIK